jgi:hexulose-6-phosphate isomerase
MYKIGIMQGRLSTPKDNRIQFFPGDGWTEEFSAATQAGFDCIEWVYDFHDADLNPISTDSGIEKAKSLSFQYGIRIRSLCAHCFIESPLVGATDKKLEELLALLDWLLCRADKLEISRIVLPIEDSSLLISQTEIARQLGWMKQAITLAEKTGIEIAIETTLAPLKLASFLSQLSHPLLKVNYDTGNSAGMGYQIEDEFAAYGHRVGSIHIKDKLLKGPTVAIGTGIVNFPALARVLRNFDFRGDIIMEAARGAPGDELAWAKKNLNFILQHLGSQA